MNAMEHSSNESGNAAPAVRRHDDLRRPAEAVRASGLGKTAYYYQMRDGLQVPFFRLSGRAVAIHVYEQDAIIAARAAGKTEDEIRALVKRLVALRGTQK